MEGHETNTNESIAPAENYRSAPHLTVMVSLSGVQLLHVAAACVFPSTAAVYIIRSALKP
jgi:hypothetical protein